MNPLLQRGDGGTGLSRSMVSGEASIPDQHHRKGASGDAVAIIEDDRGVRTALGRLLKSAGFSVESFCSAEEFLQLETGRQPVCLVLDVGLPGMNGLELQSQLAADHPCVPIVFVSGDDDPQTRSQAIQAGASAFLDKPFSDEALLDSIYSALCGKGIEHE